MAMYEASFRYPGWRVVIACFTMTMFGFGFGFYGHSVYLAALTTTNGGDAPRFATSTVSAAVTAYYLSSALIMVFISNLMARLGPRLFAMTGAAMMGVSLLLISRITSPIELFVAYLAMAPAFAMLTNAAVANILALWFHRKRGLAMSLALTGGGVGGVIIVPSLVWLSGKLSFPTALQLIAAGTLPVLLLVVAVWIFDPPRVEARATGESDHVPMQHQPTTRRWALQSPHYWTIAGPLMLAIMVQVAFVVHQAAFLLPMLGLQGAGVAVLLTALMAATSRIVLGFFVDRLDQRRLGAVLLVMQAISLLAVITFGTPLAAYLASAVFGFACRRDDHAARASHSARIPARCLRRAFRPNAGDHSDRQRLRPQHRRRPQGRSRKLYGANHRLHGARNRSRRSLAAANRTREVHPPASPLKVAICRVRFAERASVMGAASPAPCGT
jgi:MFS family permease